MALYKFCCPDCEGIGTIECDNCMGTGDCYCCKCEVDHTCGWCNGSGEYDCEACCGRGYIYGGDKYIEKMSDQELSEEAVCSCGRLAQAIVGKEEKCPLCEAEWAYKKINNS